MRISDELLQRRLAREGLTSVEGLNLTAQEKALAGTGPYSARLHDWHEAWRVSPHNSVTQASPSASRPSAPWR